MLLRIAALLPLCSHVRELVSAARPKDSSFLQGLRFNGDGTTFNPFGTVNIGSTIIIDATGGVGTYTVAPDCTGTLSILTGPNFNIFGPGAQQVWTTQIAGGASVGTAYECRSKSSSAVATRFDLSPITGFGAVYPRQAHYAFTTWQIGEATQIVSHPCLTYNQFCPPKFDQFAIGEAKEGHAHRPRFSMMKQ